jgi:hypothetical protein
MQHKSIKAGTQGMALTSLTWKTLPDGLIGIKFIFLFRPKHQIQQLTEQHLKLIPVHKSLMLELER